MQAYSDVGYVGYFNSNWSSVKKNLEKSGYTQSTNKDGIIIDVSTASGTSPVFQATIKIKYSP